MSVVKDEDKKEKWTLSSKLQHHLSTYVLASFSVLFVSALTFFVAIGTVNWYSDDENMRIGIWQFCVTDDGIRWECHICVADFIMAVQTFVILCVIGYACAVVFCVISFAFKSQRSSRLITIGLCVLNFCIVSLQIMTLICYGVKVERYSYTLQKDYLSMRTYTFKISWSFGVAVLSTILTTIAGICSIIEIRNIAMQVLENA